MNAALVALLLASATPPAPDPADARADALVAAMTLDEKLQLISGVFGTSWVSAKWKAADARPQSAGYVAGVPRLHLTPQWETDAGIGVATQGVAADALRRTALPSGLAVAATWDPTLARAGGAMIGAEARHSGFNVMLAGGINLVRDPGAGRNFEYAGEDPWLAGTIVGASVAGIQSNHLVSTVKHFALNNQASEALLTDVAIDDAAARQSDLLAFEIAIDRGHPGAVMCGYNLVGGDFACESRWLLTTVLKQDWGYKGYVMSDWGAAHDGVKAALAGLDEENGILDDTTYIWRDKLKAAIAAGRVPMAVLDDKVRRVARSLIASGAMDDPVTVQPERIDYAADGAVTQRLAESGIVLLKNQGGVLPLAARARRIALFGGHADKGVLSGGGSSQVYSAGGSAVPDPDEAMGFPHPRVYHRSPPLDALRAERPDAAISYADGDDLAAAARQAKAADVAIVFVTQWTAETMDFSLDLSPDQNALVEAVAAANPHTVLVLETGGAVRMPWAARVKGIVEAWYPGSRGGPAIARILTGAANPSGHLPVSFPARAEDYPRPVAARMDKAVGPPHPVPYREGAAVGYKWLEQQKIAPAFPFGFGLSYTRFRQDGLGVTATGTRWQATARLRNRGPRQGADVAQLYATPLDHPWEAPRRLVAYGKADLAPGEARAVTMEIDPRLLATWDTTRHRWHIQGGRYRFTLAAAAEGAAESQTVMVEDRWL